MKKARTIGLVTAVTVALSSGCQVSFEELAERLSPSSPAGVAKTIAARYMAGDYAGTINNTLDDPVKVYHFTYANGVTLWALLLLHEQTGDARYLRQVRTSLAKYADDDLYRPERGDDPIDYLGSMAHATLEYSLRAGDDQLLNEALSAASFFHDGVARTPEGLIAYHSHPERGRIWADALFMVLPLMAKAGRELGDESYYDDVLAQFRGFSARLRDAGTGLYHQGWNWHGSGASPGYWGRANGWVAVAMVEVLDAIPAGYPGRNELLASFQDFARAIADHQGTSGAWHQLLDRPDSYEESSCTGLFLHALARGVERGWLGDEYRQVVERGAAGLARMISGDGDIENVCPGTGTQASEQAYLDRGPRRNDSHGIGPALLGMCAAARLSDDAE